MGNTEIERDLCSLERLIARVTLGEPAPLATWKARLESVLERDGLVPEERAHLVSLIAVLLMLERRASKATAH